MPRWLTFLAALLVLAALGLAAFILIPVQRTAPETALPADWQPKPGAGLYAMRASDCLACHTSEDGDQFAGGRPIHSALGTIYSANITPDAATGIGGWTLDQFRAALIDGISADGSHLYPAMPYENYRLLAEEDIRALYDYFLDEVQPVANPVPEAELMFPFNQRWGIRALNWLTLRHQPGFTPRMGNVDLDRGQYLVEAPGHCAACHSPRTIYMGQNGITADQPAFLTGGKIEGWEAPPLRGAASVLADWSVDDLALYLATGRNRYSTANGEMALVVEHSLQHLSDNDIYAISSFLKVLDGKVDVPRHGLGEPQAALDPADSAATDAPDRAPSASSSSAPTDAADRAPTAPALPPGSAESVEERVQPSPSAAPSSETGPKVQAQAQFPAWALPLALPHEPANDAGAATAQMLTAAAPDMPLGPRLYLDNCAACHFVTGRGSPEIFPALQGNSLVQSTEVEPLISIILHGAEVPGTKLRPMPLRMQGYADRLDDAEIAALASFLRGAWGNHGTGISTETVANIRAATQTPD